MNIEKCLHNNTDFIGEFSLVGYYLCRDCKQSFSPVEFHKIKNLPHIQLPSEHNIHAYQKLGINVPSWVYAN